MKNGIFHFFGLLNKKFMNIRLLMVQNGGVKAIDQITIHFSGIITFYNVFFSPFGAVFSKNMENFTEIH